MRKKWKSNLRRIAGLLLAVAVLAGCYPGRVLAAEQAGDFQVRSVSPGQGWDGGELSWTVFEGEGNPNARAAYLYDCSIGLGYTSKGLHMEFMTTCSEKAEEVGVSDVKIEHKVGIFWLNFAKGADASCEDDSSFYGQADYDGVEYGETYRVSCRHFAYAGGNYLYHDSVTSGFKCTY